MYIDEPPTINQLSQFLHTMDVLNRARKQAPWDMADLMLTGLKEFCPAQMSIPDLYDLVSEQLEVDRKTLMNYASCARSFPPERRRERLEIGHHIAVLGQDEERQEYLLDMAGQNAWSVARLRAEAHSNIEQNTERFNPHARFDAEQLFHNERITLVTDLHSAEWKVNGRIVRVQSNAELRWTVE